MKGVRLSVIGLAGGKVGLISDNSQSDVGWVQVVAWVGIYASSETHRDA